MRSNLGLCGFVALAACTLPALGYDVGVGIGDITGPAVEVGFMGYAYDGQIGEGIHMRQFARAFVIADSDNSSNRIAFVSIDAGMGSDVLNKHVIERLEAELGKGVYTFDNVCISGTHTHSAPAGFLQYTIFQTVTYGFVDQTFDAMVQGVTRAILLAHRSAKPGRIRYSSGNLFESNRNRSPTSYLLNSAAEREEYKDEGDTDKGMLQLRFDSEDGKPLGVLNWFAVHGTSMNHSNKLISGDNRGYASYLFEKEMNGKHSMPGTGSFVAAFASTNLGDVTPNTKGAFCRDSGLPCDSHSTCSGKEELCYGIGPGKNGDMFDSVKIIGKKQYDHAMNLYQAATKELTGSIDYRHSFVNFDGLSVKLKDGTEVSTCSAAYGYSFAAGTTDGCGMFDFKQGQNSTNPFWKTVSDVLKKPSQAQVDCHRPKPILLDLADLNVPYKWEGNSLAVQILRVGELVIASAPIEFTTMAGRRIRKALKNVFSSSDLMGAQAPVITIAGLANGYAHYTTTFEEYQGQRYEAGSTVHGPHQLSGFIQEFERLSTDMIQGRQSATGQAPPDNLKYQLRLLPGVLFDFSPGFDFGKALTKPSPQHVPGDVVVIEFQSGNPRNDLMLESTFLTIDEQVNSTAWKTIATDGDFETVFKWKDTIGHGLSAESHAWVEWTIPEDVEPGTYRICHQGARKSLTSAFKVVPYRGCSDSFAVTRSSPGDVVV